MLTGKETPISSEYYQVNNGGDIAALFGVCKALIEADDALKASGKNPVAGRDATPKDPDNAAMIAFAASMASAAKKHVLDHDFIKEHTTGFEEFAATARAHQWDELERVSGLTRAEMKKAAATYANSNAVMMVYGMGLTQQLMGVENVQAPRILLERRYELGKRRTDGEDRHLVRERDPDRGERVGDVEFRHSVKGGRDVAGLHDRFAPGVVVKDEGAAVRPAFPDHGHPAVELRNNARTLIYSLEQQLLQILAALTKPRISWPLIYLLTAAYVMNKLHPGIASANSVAYLKTLYST